MIRKLLVANRGEVARRVVRSARAMGIATVALASDPDAQSPHAREADEDVRRPGATPAETYLRVDAVVDAGRRGGVVVVCDLPRRLTDATQAALDAADLVVVVSLCDVRACAATATLAPSAS